MSRNEFICDYNVIHSDVVASTMSNMPNAEVFFKLAEFYKIIGDTTRVKILFALIRNITKKWNCQM